jgi:AraC-like DNA-binding protein
MTLVEVLDAEAAAIAAGEATTCGAPGLGDTPVPCARISTHLVDGQAARESHAYRDGDPPTWTTAGRMTRPRTRPQPRGGDGKFVRTIEAAQRDAEAARLRERGHTYRQIAAELGYADPGEAHHAVNRAFAAIPAEGVAELRAQMLAQLDYATRQAIKVLEAQPRHGLPRQGDPAPGRLGARRGRP